MGAGNGCYVVVYYCVVLRFRLLLFLLLFLRLPVFLLFGQIVARQVRRQCGCVEECWCERDGLLRRVHS